MATFLGIKSLPLIRKYQFTSEVGRLKSAVQLAKQLAVNTRSDVIVNLKQTKDGIRLVIMSAEKEKILPGQSNIIENFKHLTLPLDIKKEGICLEFSSSGQELCKYYLEIYSKDKNFFTHLSDTFSCEKDDG